MGSVCVMPGEVQGGRVGVCALSCVDVNMLAGISPPSPPSPPAASHIPLSEHMCTHAFLHTHAAPTRGATPPPSTPSLRQLCSCQVRAVSARAMGSLMHGLGQEQFSDLLPWLMTTLKSEGAAVERSGAAQVRAGQNRGGGGEPVGGGGALCGQQRRLVSSCSLSSVQFIARVHGVT